MPRKSNQPPAPTGTPLRIIPLGGVGEIGKNMYVFEYGDDIVVIDCGLMFPDEEMFGIDLVVPDITYLRDTKANVKAFLITHAHEDHVGGLPYILPEFPGVPVYASTLARGLLGNKVKEHKLHNNPLLSLEPGDELQIGPFTAIPFRIGHSIPDAMGIALRTPVGTVVHTGDFKFDHTPVDGKLSRLPHPRQARRGRRHLPAVRLDPGREPRLHAVGADRRRGLPGDHGAARRPGHRGHLRQQHRPRPAGPRRRRDASTARSRSSGARWSRTSGSPSDLGYLTYDTGRIVAKDRLNDMPDNKLVICTTGAQGEPMAGLARMANRDHRFVEIRRATRSSSAPARSPATRST